MDEEAVETAAKNARRAATVAVIALVVMAAVALIDTGIKRAVLDEVVKARQILDEFKRVAKEAQGEPAGTPEAGEDRSPAVAGVDAGGGVVHDAAAGAVLDPAAGNGRPAPAKRKTGVAGGPPGDG